MKTKVYKTKNVFGQDVFFIVQRREYDNEIQGIAGVGNLIKYYPSDCEVSSGQIAADRIIDLSENRIRVISYCSDGSYFRFGSSEGEITPAYLNDLIVYGYRPEKTDNGIFLKLENKDYDMLIFLKNDQYHSKKLWRDGIARAGDSDDLNTDIELDAILAVLANHF